MILLLLSFVITVSAQQVTTNQQRYEKFLEQQNQRSIDQTKEQLAKAERQLDVLKKRKTRGKAEKRKVREEKKAVRDRIKVQRRSLTRLNREKQSKSYARWRPTIFYQADLYVGLIGSVREHNLDGPSKGRYYIFHTVSQIIDEKQMLVYGVKHLYHTPSWDYPRKSQTQPFLMRGMPTTGMVDGQDLELGGKCFEVTGTQKYETASGTNTVFVLEPFDMTGITP